MDKYGLQFDEQPLLDLFGVSDLDDISDEDIKLAYEAVRAIESVYKMRRSAMAASTSIEDRLTPISAATARLNAGPSQKQSTDFKKRGVKFYSDERGRVFAIAPSSGKVYAQRIGSGGRLQVGDLVPYTTRFDVSKVLG